MPCRRGQVFITTHHFIVGLSGVGDVVKILFLSSFFLLKHHWKVYNIQNSKLCFCDMKIMSLRNGGDSVNKESTGQVVYRVTTIPK